MLKREDIRSRDLENFDDPVTVFDGGHAMVFTRLDGKRMIALHSPSTPNDEWATFMPY